MNSKFHNSEVTVGVFLSTIFRYIMTKGELAAKPRHETWPEHLLKEAR